ncbi:coronatine-insensitive protein homolog 1a-like [Wolffia australiana]
MERHEHGGRAIAAGISDVALEFVMGYIEDPSDRDAISRVCRKWNAIDSMTRKHITIAFCYATTPARLCQRFPRVESLKLKGKPRAAMFNLIPEDWGGYAGPWIKAISRDLDCLKDIHLRRMIVKDTDLELLVTALGPRLSELKLDKCSGFSTDALSLLARSCSGLRTLFLEESSISEKDGKWLHELAISNSNLETLNFFMTELRSISCDDLVLLAKNCRSLRSLKISDCDVLDLAAFFRAATGLEEFSGGSFNEPGGAKSKYLTVRFPPKLSHLGLNFMETNEVPIIFPFAANLKRLDLQFTFLSTEDHCLLIQRCPSLEILEVREVIGDRGLEIVAERCKKLRRLRIERGDDEYEDEQGKVSHRGLLALAKGCRELEYLAVYVSDICNSALEAIGSFSKKMRDFRLVLLDREKHITELPLDDGVRALLRGCENLQRFALYLRQGGLSDAGLRHIGELSCNVKYMLLGYTGEFDAGLLDFSRGCPKLQKLELRGCCFSERALALAMLRLTSLKYLWVQGNNISPDGGDLLSMACKFRNVEFIPARKFYGDDGHDLVAEQPAQILAYYSLAGMRDDYPNTVLPIHPLSS